MAQFDIMISFSLVFYFLITVYFFYSYNIVIVIPNWVETQKFRNKISIKFNSIKNIINLGFYALIIDFSLFKIFI